MRRRAAILLLALAATAARAQGAPPPHNHGGAPAADPAACTQFDWSLLREQAWFSAASLPRVESGGTLAAMPAALLGLKPQGEVAPPFAPSREPKPGAFGGILRLDAPLAPGAYQVTLSDRAWIDVSQDGTTTRPATAHTMRPGCPMLAKSVRFQLGTAPITIVISNAPSDTIRIAVAPVD